MSNGMAYAIKASFCTMLLNACSQSEHPSSAIKIVDGHAAEAFSYPAVALLKEDSAGSFYAYCSGVMISADRLLTAAHCTQNAEGKVHEPSEVRVQWGVNNPETSLADAATPESLSVHPLYDSGALGKDKDGLIKPGEAFDVALWKLQQPITDEAFHPATIFPSAELAESLQKEQEILLLGYGQTSAWESPWESHGLMTATTAYKPRISWNVRRRELVNGRMITHTVTLDLQAFTNSEFYAGDRGQPDTCKGDSGGPAMMKDSSGQWKLLGLTSRGDTNCDRGGVYTLVPAMQKWFESL